MYLGKTVEEVHELLVSKKVTPLELTKEAIEALKKEETNAIETICEKEALEFAATLVEPEVDNLFWGIPYVAKDNFSTKDILTTASSEILKDYVPVYDATVITKLKEAKAVLIAKSTLDELAMGGTGTTGHKGTTYNPYDPTHTYKIGGSSCGSASLTAQGIVPFALGSDTGDSVRKPASYAGLVGFKPTWGRISRYGLFPFAPSLDHVAYFTRSVKDSAALLEVLAGEDLAHDATCSVKPVEKYTEGLTGDLKGKKIARIKEIDESVKDKVILEGLDKVQKALEEAGATVEKVNFDQKLLAAVYPAYMIISCAEATSNNANLDGIKFGPRVGEASSYQDVMMNARTNGFSELIRRRFVIGSYSLFKANQEELFLRAQKVRRLIVNKTNEILSQYDAILTPCGGIVRNPFASNSDDVSDRLDIHTIIVENHLGIGNFGGFPSISVPMGLDNGFPFACNIMTKVFTEKETLNIAYAIEKKLGLKNLSTMEVK
jgi:aspartyl-tRNA(Asn)/glutamyl-tRNA(Gln) amidotransferase subunit A